MIMLTKPLLLIILAACAAPSGAAANSSPTEKVPPSEPPEDDPTYFCCDTVSNGKSGEGCDEIAAGHIVLCGKVLKCPDGYTNDEGKVTCA
jgi:hypothetical protein